MHFLLNVVSLKTQYNYCNFFYSEGIFTGPENSVPIDYAKVSDF